jgi:DNA-binding MarR family transcriptional regulator
MGSHVSGESAAIMDALRRLVRFLRLGTRAAEARTGISSAQLFVLQRLESAPALSIAELAERTLTDPSSVSTVVAKLVARGMVSRRTSPEDRRRASIALTARGRQVLSRAPELAQVRLLEALESMPEAERSALGRTLVAWVHGAGADELEPRMLFEDEPAPRRARPRTTADA